MNEVEQFARECADEIARLGADPVMAAATRQWFDRANAGKYSYHFSWMGRPIIQYPQDIVAVQELIWRIQPDLVIETGIAHGGSLILSASILTMLEYADCVRSGIVLDPTTPRRRVLGIDIDIRSHNRVAIDAHPMRGRIDLIEGSSISPEVVERVRETARQHGTVLILLDSNHTHDHVLAELEAYAPLTSQDSYCVVFDTVIEDLPTDGIVNRPWGKGNSPKTAVVEYLQRLSEGGRRASDGKPLRLEIDREMDSKLLVTVAPRGYLRRVPC